MIDQMVTVAHPWWARALAWTGLPVLGAALGALLTQAVQWAATQPLPLMKAPLVLAASVPDPPATVGSLVIGGLAGLVFAGYADQESLSVTVSRTEVTLTRSGMTRVIDRSVVAVAFADRDRLVLLDRRGAEVAREPSHLPAERLAAAFTAYGIAWSAADPYADAYRRWVPQSPDLPAGARALFAARERALQAGDSQDLTELREELARLGVVVRDEKKRQYWRRVEAG